jgi:hypothetical protein
MGNYTLLVFKFSNTKLLNININLQTIVANFHNPSNAAVQRQTKWIRMQLTFRPRSADVGALRINPILLPNSSIVPIYLKAHRTPHQ